MFSVPLSIEYGLLLRLCVKGGWNQSNPLYSNTLNIMYLYGESGVQLKVTWSITYSSRLPGPLRTAQGYLVHYVQLKVTWSITYSSRLPGSFIFVAVME